ncbi:MAG: cyclase family protein [Vulcanimicrobiota bacterium]
MKPRARIDINGTLYHLELHNGIDISLPVRFDEAGLQVFGAQPARMEPYRAGEQALEVREGAGCNCPVFHFSAHLHGTHTECVGHLSRRFFAVQEVAGHRGIQTALLVSVEPSRVEECEESYLPSLHSHDLVVTRQTLESKLEGGGQAEALIVRTGWDFAAPPAFFTNQAMALIAEWGFQSLLVDTPSVDRLEDEGRLSNHHIFWGVEQGSHEVIEPSPKTITELVRIPGEVKDGLYALDLNIGNILADAAPSRPVLYEMVPL